MSTSTTVESLTMLYLRSQNLNGCSPEQLVEKFQVAHDLISKAFKEKSPGASPFSIEDL